VGLLVNFVLAYLGKFTSSFGKYTAVAKGLQERGFTNGMTMGPKTAEGDLHVRH
jgi:hypothetical protein